HHAVDMKVRDGDVAGILDVQGQRETALAPLLFGLQRVDVPVGDIAQHDLVAHVMLARHLVHASLGGGIGDKHARLREGAGGPDVDEPAAPTVGHPQAGILPIPAAVEVGVGSVVIVVDIFAAAVDFGSAVAAQEAHVIHHGILACHPFQRDSPGVDAVGVDADSRKDVGVPLGRLDDRYGTAGALESGGPVGQYQRRGAGVQAHQDAVRLQNDGAGDAIFSGGKVEAAMACDGCADGFRVVGFAIAL